MYGFIANVGYDFADGEAMMFPQFLYVGDEGFVPCYAGKPLGSDGIASIEIMQELHVGIYVKEEDFSKVSSDKPFIFLCDPVDEGELKDRITLEEANRFYNDLGYDSDDIIYVAKFSQYDENAVHDEDEDCGGVCNCSGVEESIKDIVIPDISIITSN